MHNIIRQYAFFFFTNFIHLRLYSQNKSYVVLSMFADLLSFMLFDKFWVKNS